MSPTGRLLPRHLHGRLRNAAGLAVAALVPLGTLVAGQGTATRLDRAVLDVSVPRSPALERLLDDAARLLPPTMPVVAAALALWCWRASARREAVFCLVAPAGAVLTTAALKPLLARPSGSGQGWMFPSGHVTAVAAVAAVAAFLLLPGGAVSRRLPTQLVPMAWISVLAAPTATSIGTVVERYHYPTDVIGGLLVALATVVVVAATLDQVPPLRAGRST